MKSNLLFSKSDYNCLLLCKKVIIQLPWRRFSLHNHQKVNLVTKVFYLTKYQSKSDVLFFWHIKSNGDFLLLYKKVIIQYSWNFMWLLTTNHSQWCLENTQFFEGNTVFLYTFTLQRLTREIKFLDEIFRKNYLNF